MKKCLLSFFACILISLTVYGQSSLKNIFYTYASNIKVCNTPYAKDCIYKISNFNCSMNGNLLTIEYNFENIKHDKFVVNLKTATIYNGMWQKWWGKWEQSGNKSIITIQDDNGIDMYSTGLQNYNQGTKQNLVTYILFDMGTVPIANRAVSQFLTLQEGYKSKDPWLQPIQETQPQTSPSKRKSVVRKKNNSQKRNSTSKSKTAKSKLGKYGE